MSHLFKFSITTEHGSISGESRANSIQQIAEVMPEAVKHYEATIVPLTGDDQFVNSEMLFHDFVHYVSDLKFAFTMTVAKVAEQHALQALAGVTNQGN